MILIPAAGEGRRFKEAGYKGPKHLIPLLGAPMVERVRDNVRPLDPHGDAIVVAQDFVGKTKGAIDTILRGIGRLEDLMPGRYDEHEKLIVANCDQLIKIPDDLQRGWGNGLIFTFQSANPAHSYVKVGRKGDILGIVEKPDTPDPEWEAVSGVYAFTQAAPFVEACQTVNENTDVLREQYVSAAIRRMIDEGYTLYAVRVPTAILGTPEDFQRFETAALLAKELS